MNQTPKDSVVVVGGGAAGLAVAYGLATKGIPVIALEFGPMPRNKADFLTDAPPETLPFRGLAREGAEAYHPDHFISESDLPYRLGNEAFRSWLKRTRVAGGKTLYWTAHTPRFSDFEFQALAKTGAGENWPLDYATLAPWYSSAERLMGVVGTREALPQQPDGIFQTPAYGLRDGEKILQASLAERGVAMIPARKAISNGASGRAPCHGCGRCSLGCPTAAKYDAFSVLARSAFKTGNFAIRYNSVVREVLIGKNGTVAGVQGVNRVTGAEFHLHAHVVVIAVSAIETARLLLDSRGPDGEKGLANHSGLVGAFLSESLGVEIEGLLPPLKRSKTQNGPHHGEHGLIPRHVNLDADQNEDFSGGWLFVTQSGAELFPSFAERIPGFGETWKREVAAWHPAMIRLYGITEVGMRRENRILCDPSKTDRWGRPLPKIVFSLSDEDRRRWIAMADAGREFLENVNAQMIATPTLRPETGGGLHACGVCRMGNDPKTSVTNTFGQTHDIPNLFIADASIFVSSLNQPTLTVTALALRQAHYIAETLKTSGFQRTPLSRTS